MGAKEDGYKIGYKKPPKDTQFQKGHSGNPRGRPKGTRNLKTDLFEELNEKITIREGGRTITTTKQRGFVKSLIAEAMRSGGRSKSVLVDLLLRCFGLGEDAEPDQYNFSPEETEVLLLLEKRLHLSPSDKTADAQPANNIAEPSGSDSESSGEAE